MDLKICSVWYKKYFIFWTNSKEIDPTPTVDDENSNSIFGEFNFLEDFGGAIPGIDEAMSFAEVMK